MRLLISTDSGFIMKDCVIHKDCQWFVYTDESLTSNFEISSICIVSFLSVDGFMHLTVFFKHFHHLDPVRRLETGFSQDTIVKIDELRRLMNRYPKYNMNPNGIIRWAIHSSNFRIVHI